VQVHEEELLKRNIFQQLDKVRAQSSFCVHSPCSVRQYAVKDLWRCATEPQTCCQHDVCHCCFRSCLMPSYLIVGHRARQMQRADCASPRATLADDRSNRIAFVCIPIRSLS
jgi:hypothetical protein